MNYTSIDNIISKCYSDLGGGATDENHKRYFQWISRGYKQLRLFKLPLDKAETLTVQTTGIRCVILPKDYVSFVSIGKVYNNHFHKFSLKADIVPNTTENCGVITQTNTLPTYPIAGAYAQGGGLNNWYYRLDEENNRILIAGNILTEATLFYKSTGVNLTGETLIPVIAEEALIAWTHYQEALNEKDRGMIAIRKQVFDGEITNLQLANWNQDAMTEAVYSTIYQGVKR
jgi:hypothetical protein